MIHALADLYSIKPFIDQQAHMAVAKVMHPNSFQAGFLCTCIQVPAQDASFDRKNPIIIFQVIIHCEEFFQFVA